MSDEWEHRFSEEDVTAFVRGQATPALVEEIEREMAHNDKLRAEISLQQGLRPALSAIATGMPPGELGWRRLEAALADAPQSNETSAPTQPDYWRIAAIALGVAVLIQGAFLVAPSFAPNEARFQTASQPEAAIELAIAFKAEASIAEIVTLLNNAGAQLADGPSALGLFRVKFETQQALIDGKILLESSDIVTLVARP